MPRIFRLLQEGGGIELAEMARTFNCGIGMAVIVDASQVETVSQALAGAGETIVEIGRIEAGERGCTVQGSAGSWGSAEAWTATHHG